MTENTVVELNRRAPAQDTLTELLRHGARQLIEKALEEELDEMLLSYSDRTLPNGRAAVVRSGHHPERDLQTGIEPVTVKVPKVRSRDGEPVTFRSALVPPYVRKTQTLEAALPWLYLKGISSGEMESALTALVGPEAQGLSASTVSRLKRSWADEYTVWQARQLDQDEWVYLWADAIHSGLRAEDAKLCALVIIGVNKRGEKRFLAIEDGVRESTQSWREVLLSLKSRGLKAAKLAVGDGALGFWAALDEVYPSTRHGRCWQHKTMNVLNYLPKTAHDKARSALQAIWHAETREDATTAFDLFIETYRD